VWLRRCSLHPRPTNTEYGGWVVVVTERRERDSPEGHPTHAPARLKQTALPTSLDGLKVDPPIQSPQVLRQLDTANTFSLTRPEPSSGERTIPVACLSSPLRGLRLSLGSG
jgi:hypothetical protein